MASREIRLDDPNLVADIEEKGRLVERGREITRKMEALAAEHKKLSDEQSALFGQVVRIKKNIFRKLKRAAGRDLGEYEVPMNADVRDGAVILLIEDEMEKFKAEWKRFDKWTEPRPIKQK